MEVGEERDYTPIATLTPHQSDSCIKVGSDESHFNVSVRSDGQSHKTVSTNHNHNQRTSFNTLDNWGHKTPTQSKRKRTGKKRLKGHGPKHVYNTLGYTRKTEQRFSKARHTCNTLHTDSRFVRPSHM